MRQAQPSALQPSSSSAGTGWGAALRGALLLIMLCGGLYPLLTVKVGGLLFPLQSTGSLIERNGRIVGSALVGQPFNAPGYFHGRPSAAAYDPFGLSGSNWAPGNPNLRARAAASSAAIARAEGVAPAVIPVDLVAASGSGIDPHVSPAAAALQIDRVAAARGLPRGVVAALVAEHVEGPLLGVLGQARVNVLQLNLALDALGAQAAGS